MKQHEDIIKGFKDFLRKEFFNLGHNNECEHKGCIELKDVLDFEKQVSNFLDQLEQSLPESEVIDDDYSIGRVLSVLGINSLNFAEKIIIVKKGAGK